MGVAYGSSLPACGACVGEGASPAAGATARTQEASGHPHVGCPSGTTSLKNESGPPEHRVARCASSRPVTAAAKNGGPCSVRRSVPAPFRCRLHPPHVGWVGGGPFFFAPN